MSQEMLPSLSFRLNEYHWILLALVLYLEIMPDFRCFITMLLLQASCLHIIL